MNEEYETRFLCNNSKVRTRAFWPGLVLEPIKAGEARGRRDAVGDLVSETSVGDLVAFPSTVSACQAQMAAGGKTLRLISQKEVMRAWSPGGRLRWLRQDLLNPGVQMCPGLCLKRAS